MEKLLAVVESGGWTVFNQIELLFVIGLPVGLTMIAVHYILKAYFDFGLFSGLRSGLLHHQRIKM